MQIGSRIKDQPENILLPWIRKYGCTDFCVLWSSGQHSVCLSHPSLPPADLPRCPRCLDHCKCWQCHHRWPFISSTSDWPGVPHLHDSFRFGNQWFRIWTVCPKMEWLDLTESSLYFSWHPRSPSLQTTYAYRMLTGSCVPIVVHGLNAQFSQAEIVRPNRPKQSLCRDQSRLKPLIFSPKRCLDPKTPRTILFALLLSISSFTIIWKLRMAIVSKSFFIFSRSRKIPTKLWWYRPL